MQRSKLSGMGSCDKDVVIIECVSSDVGCIAANMHRLEFIPIV